jgi:hypothetical protein
MRGFEGGPGNRQWDAHDDIEENHLRMAAQTDQPFAALLKVFEAPGLLDSTLVFWGGEFGRSAESQGVKAAITMILAFPCGSPPVESRAASS